MDIKILTVEQMRAVEAAADRAGHSYAAMMQLAGRAVADLILTEVRRLNLTHTRILFLIGPGNNGGDGLVAAQFIHEALPEVEITAYLLKSRKDEGLKSAKKAGIKIVEPESDSQLPVLSALLKETTILVDALFGTGTQLPIKGLPATVLERAHEILKSHSAETARSYYNPAQSPPHPSTRPLIIAVDNPSGVDCDTGETDPMTLAADFTLTFAAPKIGLLRFPAAEFTGTLLIGDIGLPPLPEIDAIPLHFANGEQVTAMLPARPPSSHKGTFGKALIVAGSANYIGAAYLAGAAAYRSGTGLVTIAAPQNIVPVLATLIPEATWLLLAHEMGVLHQNAVPVLREELGSYDALLIGPGLGQEDATKHFLQDFLQPETPKTPKQRRIGFGALHEPEPSQEAEERATMPPLVIDADGLNLLARVNEWWTLLPAKTILTPHPAEFARLAAMHEPDAVQKVQSDRLQMALAYAQKWQAIVVLKGAFTVIAEPTGHATVLPFASSALATAGTGDVLAGLIVGLLAQGLSPSHAAIAGAWLHGYAGQYAAQDLGTERSVIAGDVLHSIGGTLAALETRHPFR